MFEQSSQLVGLGVGGLGGGLGIAGYKSWIIALVILLVLVGLDRWTMRPARRAARAKPPPPVPDIQATASRLKDSAIIGQAAASDILGKGAQAGRIVQRFDVRDITEATALALMEDMLTK